MHPVKNTINWQKALDAASNATRCGAKTRAAHSCRSPAMRNGRCRMHGGKSTGAPCGAANGRYKHGKYTYSTRQQKMEFFEVLQHLNLLCPKQKASARIDLEDIDFEAHKIKTIADIKVASDKILGAINKQELSLEEASVVIADFNKKRECLLKSKIDKLVMKIKGNRKMKSKTAIYN